MRLGRTFNLLFSICLVLFFLASCSQATALMNKQNSTKPQNLAEVLFRVRISSQIPTNAKLMLEVLDDVTGLYFNSSRYEMTSEEGLSYSVRIPLPVSADIKYRYVLTTTGSSYEFNSQNEQVRFRIARINGPEIFDDIVTGWVNISYTGPVGRISGQVIDAETNAPIPNLLITIGGLQTFSASDGSFLIHDIATGVHNLVIYSIDGRFETFQQGALIAENANTPVNVTVKPRKTTKVTFSVSLPSGVDYHLPLRFISNLNSLGNAYADLAGGSTGNAVNYPIMEKMAGNRYTITMELPIGLYLRYKYSLGDGFWNAELDLNDAPVVRDLLVTENLSTRDKVITFTSKNSKPVQLIVQAPANTPAYETVFIQLNPFGWMEPLPMVSAGANQWKYTIYSPLQYFDEIGYRYCRNGLCDVAAELTDISRSFSPSKKNQVLGDVITAWNNLDTYSTDTTQFLALENVQPKPGFIAGVELSEEKPAVWQNSIDEGLTFASGIGGDWVILTPTWTLNNHGNLPDVSLSPDSDLFLTELMAQNSHVMMSGQKAILFPAINYAQTSTISSQSPVESSDWQLVLIKQYERFIYHHAEIAQILGIEGLIIEIPQAFSELDGSQIGLVTELIDWPQLMAGIRQRYSGRLIGHISLDHKLKGSTEWLNQVDIIYITFALENNDINRSVSDIQKEVDLIIQGQVRPVFELYNKPVIVGFSSPSIDNNGKTDLASQAKTYSAAILCVASQDWISGFISRGYFPYVELQDDGLSIYRKPASEILWFWFHYLLNKAPDQ